MNPIVRGAFGSILCLLLCRIVAQASAPLPPRIISPGIGENVYGFPIEIRWEYGANPLTNGGFELGQMAPWTTQPRFGSGWSIVRANSVAEGVLCAQSRFPARKVEESLFQTIQVPDTADSWRLQWQERFYGISSILNPTAAGEIWSVFISTNNQPTPKLVHQREFPSGRVQEDWTLRTFDLTPWRGQSVRIAFVTTGGTNSTSRLLVNLDAVALKPIPAPGTEYDVYVGQTMNFPPETLAGRTNQLNFKVRSLPREADYFAKVVARNAEGEVHSDIVPFHSYTLTPEFTIHAEFAPRDLVKGQPIPLSLVMLDKNHDVQDLNSDRAVVRVNGLRSRNAGILIAGFQDGFVQLINVGDKPVALRGYRLVGYHVSRASIVYSIELSSVPDLHPLASLVLVKDAATAEAWQQRFPAGSRVVVDSLLQRQCLLSGLALRDGTGEIIDFVHIRPFLGEDRFPGDRWGDSEWVANSLTFETGCPAFRRKSATDSNSDLDWENWPVAALNTPVFLGAAAPVGLTPLGAVFAPPLQFRAGRWQGTLLLDAAAQDVALSIVVDRERIIGERRVMLGTIREDSHELQLIPKVGMHESDGQVTHAFEIRLEEPAAEAFEIRFATEPPGIIEIPTIHLAKGATNGFADALLLDDAAYNSTRSVVVTTQAGGYAAAVRAIEIANDDPPGLEVLIADPILEGQPTTVRLALRTPASVDIPMGCSIRGNAFAEGYGINTDFVVTIPKGSREALVPIVVGDDFRLGAPDAFQFSAAVAGWPKVEVTRQPVSNDVANPKIELLGYFIGGDSRLGAKFHIGFGGELDHAVQTTLSSSDESVLKLPPEISVAGNGVIFQAFLGGTDNPKKSRTTLLRAEAPGYPPAEFRLEVPALAPSRIEVTIPEGNAQWKSYVNVHTHVFDLDGKPWQNVVNAPGTVGLYSREGLLLQPGLVALPPDNGEAVHLVFHNDDTQEFRVVVSLGGVEGVSEWFPVSVQRPRQLPLHVGDAVRVGAGPDVVASVLATSPQHANEIVLIEAASGQIRTLIPFPVGSFREDIQLASSFDGSVFFVLDKVKAVARLFRQSDGIAIWEASVTDVLVEPAVIWDTVLLRESPWTLAIRTDRSKSVLVSAEGLSRPSGFDFVPYGPSRNGRFVAELTLPSGPVTGLCELGQGTELLHRRLPNNVLDVHLNNSVLYLPDGHQIRYQHEFKEDTLQGVREWPLSAFQFSSVDQRGLYTLRPPPFEFLRRLSGIDVDSGLEYVSLPVADISGDPWKFVDCGSNVVAFATDADFGFLNLPQNPRIAPEHAIDGTLMLSAGARSGVECVWEARMTNQTETAQRSLRLEVHLPVGFTLLETNATEVAVQVDGAWHLIRRVPALAAHEAMDWRIRCVPNMAGPARAQLGLGALNASGTRVTLWIEGAGDVSPGNLVGNAVPLADIGPVTAVDLPGNRLFTVAGTRIVSVDLATLGRHAWRENIFGVSVLKLDASGRFLYAIQDNGASILRVDVKQATLDSILRADNGWRWIAIEPDPNNPMRLYAARTLMSAPFERNPVAMDLVEDMSPKTPAVNLRDFLTPTLQLHALRDRDAVGVLVHGEDPRWMLVEQNQGHLELRHQRALPNSLEHCLDSGTGWLLFNSDWVLEEHLQRSDLTILPKLPGFLLDSRLARSAEQETHGQFWITVGNSDTPGDVALVFKRWDNVSGALLSQTRLERPEGTKPGVVVVCQENGRVLWRSELGVAMTDIGPMERRAGTDLKVQIKNPETTFVMGQGVAVDVVVENQGASAAVQVLLVMGADPELTPKEVEWIEGSSGGAWNGGNTITLGDIDPGERKQLSVHLAPSTIAEHLLHWKVSSSGLESTPGDNHAAGRLKADVSQGLIAHALRLPFTAFDRHATSHHLFAADGEFIHELDPSNQQVLRSLPLPESVSKLVVSAPDNVVYALTSNRVELLRLDLSSGTVRSIVRKAPYAPTALLDFCTVPGQLGSLIVSETGVNPSTYVINPDGTRRPNEINLALNPSMFESGAEGRAGVFDGDNGRCSDRLLEFALRPAGLSVTRDFLSGGCAATWVGAQPVVEPSALDLSGGFFWKLELPAGTGPAAHVLKTVRTAGMVELQSFPSVAGDGVRGPISHAERSISFIHERQLGMVSLPMLQGEAKPPSLEIRTEKAFLQMGTLAPVTIRITNSGPVSLVDVETFIDWPLPIVGFSSEQGTVGVDPLDFGKARWHVGTLAAGQSSELTLEVLVASEITEPFVCAAVSANAEETIRNELLQVVPSDVPGSQVSLPIDGISRLALSPLTQRVYALGTRGLYEFDGRTGLQLRGPLALDGMEPSDCIFDTTENRALVLQRAFDTPSPAVVVDLETWKVIRRLTLDPDKVFVDGIAVPDHPRRFWLIAQNSFSGGGQILEISDTETTPQPIPPLEGFSKFLGTSDRGVLVLETSQLKDNYRVMEVSSVGGAASLSRVWDHSPANLIAANKSEFLGSDGSLFSWGQSLPQHTLPGGSALHPFALWQRGSGDRNWMLTRDEGARKLNYLHLYDRDWRRHVRAISFDVFGTRDAIVTQSDLFFLANTALFITRLGAPPDEGSGLLDQDADGLPDAWENTYQLNPLDPTDATKDADQDGYTNAEELYLGTHPKDPQSRLSIMVERLDSSHVQFGFYVSGLRVYRIESRGIEEGAEWIPISGDFQRPDGPVKFTLETDAASALWRVVVR